jgi:alpha,alpha-trehalase
VEPQIGVVPDRGDAARASRPALPPPPEELYGELFVAVQSAQVFSDQKIFVDAVPNLEPRVILEQYQSQKSAPSFDLKTFVGVHFTLPVELAIQPPADQSLRAHIDWLWPALTRKTSVAPPWSSLVPLPEPYVVPGGRFREVYYWDSYFTMLGLNESGQVDLVRSMLANFAYEIDQFGHIPNGNRTYYLSRSQPPFFSHMVELAAANDASVLVEYLPELRREYAYWMEGADGLTAGSARERVVQLPDGTLLNRYWDERDTPRSESYQKDVETARAAAGSDPDAVYRDLRAAAASGWDFSSRWFGDSRKLSTIRTTAIVPVDLNSLLYHLESSIAQGCEAQRDTSCAGEFSERAGRRAAAIERYLWNEHGYYGDYDWARAAPRDNLTAASLFPLFVGVASPEHAQQTARKVQAELLAAGGLLTTARKTGQQWDAPNGWAPLQWVAVAGLRRYEETALAKRIGERFLARVSRVYGAQGKLVEKYDVTREGSEGGGGEYPNQDGFGWTNGVTLMLLDLYEPQDPAARRGAPRPRPAPAAETF